jgi:dTDP-glucose pyrophosphorylase
VGFVEEFQRDRPAAQILLTRVPDPQMFGVAQLDNGRVVRLVEKPSAPARNRLKRYSVYCGRQTQSNIEEHRRWRTRVRGFLPRSG